MIGTRRPTIGRTTDLHAASETVGLHWIAGQVVAVVELLPPSGLDPGDA